MAKKTPSPGQTRPVRARGRNLLAVDNAPIRAEALDRYRRAEAKVNEVRERLESFETRDLPAWRRWDAARFGPLLTELRSVLSELEQKQDLLDEIDEEQQWSNCSRLAAYRRVMRRREAPGEEDEPSPPAPEAEAEGGRAVTDDFPLPDGMTAAAFDRLSPREQRKYRDQYEDAAAGFEFATGQVAPDLDDLLNARRLHETAEAPEATPVPARPANRLKELYRLLVRQLHPDTAGAQTPREREFWHEVQDAYQTGNLERLEALHGRLQVGLRGDGHGLPVQVLRAMTDDLVATLQGLAEQLRKASKHAAWHFRGQKSHAKMAAQRERGLRLTLATARGDLAWCTRELATLAAKAGKPARAARRAAAPKPRRVTQREFF